MLVAELQQVSKAFPKSGRVLEGINLGVRAGEFLSLLGPSGCGKTTLLRIFSGLIPIDSGALHFRVDRQPGDIAFVFQEPSLLPWLTVEKNVSLPSKLLGHAADAECVAGVIELVGLSKARDYFPRELSGGMKMRVALARALATRPRFLLLDEPFGALDEVTRLELEEELSVIVDRQKMTTLLVTHSISEAVFLSDRVLLLSGLSQTINSEFRVDREKPRQGSFRFDPVYSDLVDRIRQAFAGLSRVR